MNIKCRNCGATWDNDLFICCPNCVRNKLKRNLTPDEMKGMKKKQFKTTAIKWKPVLENFGIHSLSDTAEAGHKISKKKQEAINKAMANGTYKPPKKPHKPRDVDLLNKVKHALLNTAEKNFEDAITKIQQDKKLTELEKQKQIKLIKEELKFRQEHIFDNKFIDKNGNLIDLPVKTVNGIKTVDVDKIIKQVNGDIQKAWGVIKHNRMRYPLKEIVSTINIPAGLPKEIKNRIIKEFLALEKEFIEKDIGKIMQSIYAKKGISINANKIELEFGCMHANEGTNFLASIGESEIEAYHFHNFYKNWNLAKKKWGWAVEGINALSLKIIHEAHSQKIEKWIEKNWKGILDYCNKEMLVELKKQSNTHINIWDNKYNEWKERARLSGLADDDAVRMQHEAEMKQDLINRYQIPKDKQNLSLTELIDDLLNLANKIISKNTNKEIKRSK